MNKLASYSTLGWTIVFTPIFFLLSAMIMLRSADSASAKVCQAGVPCDRKSFKWLDCYIYNVVVWGSGFVFGLCFTYFKLLKLKINLIPRQMKSWPLINWVVFLIFIGVAFGIIGTILYYYYRSGIMGQYIGLFILILAALFVPAVIFRRKYSLHIHHYTLGMIFLALIAYPIYPLAWLHGTANGWMIEGGTTYAYDPIFKKKKKQPDSNKLGVVKQVHKVFEV